jgi:two-component system sensor histidine kinase KdpD
VAVATRAGTWPAIVTSVGSFLAYDFLFVAPRLTLAVADPQTWLSLLLFLIVAAVVGHLTALLTSRAREAEARAREGAALFHVARALATRGSVREAADEVVERLRAEGHFERVWIVLDEPPAPVRRLADTKPVAPLPADPLPWLLHRQPGDEPARWVRTHVGAPRPIQKAPPTLTATPTPPGDLAIFRVTIAAEGASYGWLAAAARSTEPAGAALPGRALTRLLSLAADQLGLALRREALQTRAASADVARRSDALKSALLESVSHDLRTPLASIRGLAGNLLDPDVPIDEAAVRRAAAAIDERAGRLSKVVGNLLDLSRIEAGAIVPDLALHDLDELVETALRDLPPAAAHRIEVALPADLPPVLADGLFVDEALVNVLDNAIRYAGAAARLRIRAEGSVPGRVDLIVEDDGPGLAETDRERIFDKFYRPERRSLTPEAPGMGIGLSVVRGLLEAMGGTARAERSELGGLAIRLGLPEGRTREIVQPPTPPEPRTPSAVR